MSLPVRGAWIEMRNNLVGKHDAVSLPVRGAWIEISPCPLRRQCRKTSLPVRGAWIEIASGVNVGGVSNVAPRAGSVD